MNILEILININNSKLSNLFLTQASRIWYSDQVYSDLTYQRPNRTYCLPNQTKPNQAMHEDLGKMIKSLTICAQQLSVVKDSAYFKF